jgi:hypothetical protein
MLLGTSTGNIVRGLGFSSASIVQSQIGSLTPQLDEISCLLGELK